MFSKTSFASQVAEKFIQPGGETLLGTCMVSSDACVPRKENENKGNLSTMMLCLKTKDATNWVKN